MYQLLSTRAPESFTAAKMSERSPKSPWTNLARGSTAEQGDNEHIPPFASLRRFIPPDKLWPINDTWYFHAGSAPTNSTLTNIRRVIDRRYGVSTSAQMFADKAQLAHYEATRAQFESFAANGWDGHKMTIYWMLNSHWPSFFGNIFDYYLRPGGAYYGAKKGLRPLSVVFDSYATGNHRLGKVSVVNQSPEARSDLRVRVRTYDLSGKVRDDRAVDGIDIASGGTAAAMTVPPGPADSRVFFSRCELLDKDGGVLAENVYWQSQVLDDVGPLNRGARSVGIDPHFRASSASLTRSMRTSRRLRPFRSKRNLLHCPFNEEHRSSRRERTISTICRTSSC